MWVRSATPAAGLSSAYVDLAFVGGCAALETSNGALLSVFATGTLMPGAVDEFGGSTLADGVAQASWVRLGVVRVQATSAGQAIFSAMPGATGFALRGRGRLADADVAVTGCAVWHLAQSPVPVEELAPAPLSALVE